LIDVNNFISNTVDSFLADAKHAVTGETILEMAINYTKQLNPMYIGDYFGFANYEYLVQPFMDMWPKVVVIKRSQIGATDSTARRDAMFALQFPGTKIVYTFPTADDMKLYVKDRFDDLIRESGILKRSLLGNPDSVAMKKFGQSSIIFKGRSTERAAISIPANRLTHDEADFSEQEIMETFRSRLGAARLHISKEHYDSIAVFEEYANRRAKEVDSKAPDFRLISAKLKDGKFIIEGGLETRFSTPTIPGYGVSRLYWGDEDTNGSDQMKLYIRHPECGMWQIPKWGPESVEGFYEYGSKPTGGPYYHKCLGCGKEIDYSQIGQWNRAYPLQFEHVAWVPTYSGREWRGYHLPWYTAAFTKSAEDMLEEFHGFKIKSRRENFFLGIPSIEANNALSLDIMNKCHKAGHEWETTGDSRSEYVLGADQGVYRVIAKRIPYTDTEVNPLGKIAIVKIGFTTNNDAFPKIETGVLRDNGELSRDMEMFQVTVSAIDNQPNETSARQFSDIHLGKVWRIVSSGSLQADIRADEETMYATESKVKALDKTIKYVMDGNLILPLEETEECREFKKQCCNLIKVVKEKTDAMGRPTGDTVSVYNKIGPEHYLHALKMLIWAMELSYLNPPSKRVANPVIEGVRLKT
jgi:hypothetical protein